MRTIRHTGKFKKDYKRETKGRSAAYAEKLDAELRAVVDVLAQDGTLAHRHHDHSLVNRPHERECHVRPDLLLIYRKPDDETLELVRLGSHAETGLA